MSERCKVKIMVGYHSRLCSRNAVKDGYCKQHHPLFVKTREVESDKRFNEKLQASPWRKLEKARERIAELEAGIKGFSCGLMQKSSSYYTIDAESVAALLSLIPGDGK